METQAYRTKGHDVKDLLEMVNQLSPEDKIKFVSQLERQKGFQEWGAGIKNGETQRGSQSRTNTGYMNTDSGRSNIDSTSRGINSSTGGKETFREDKSSNGVRPQPVGSDIE